MIITRTTSNTCVSIDKPNTGLKIGEYVCRNITLIGTDVDVSNIEEVELEEN